MNDEAEVLLPVGVPLIDNAKTGFDVVVASTSSPAAMIAASIGSSLVVLILCHSSMYKYNDIFYKTSWKNCLEDET